jgi:GT2 family glycosyltransferase
VKREAIQAVGGYDPFLRAGHEEIDLAMNLRRSGFRIEFEPAAIVKHFHTGVSYKRGRFFYDNHLMRLYLYLKHFCTNGHEHLQPPCSEAILIGFIVWLSSCSIL